MKKKNLKESIREVMEELKELERTNLEQEVLLKK